MIKRRCPLEHPHHAGHRRSVPVADVTIEARLIGKQPIHVHYPAGASGRSIAWGDVCFRALGIGDTTHRPFISHTGLFALNRHTIVRQIKRTKSRTHRTIFCDHTGDIASGDQ